jgi:hypothetical protein
MTKSAKSKTITVKVNEENPEPLDILAKSIIDVAEAFRRIDSCRLTRKAIVLLIQDAIGSTRITRQAIIDVLDYGPRLDKIYTKPSVKK